MFKVGDRVICINDDITNSLTREIYAYMSNYIYLQHDAKLDCYQYTYNLMEIPYQRSDS